MDREAWPAASHGTAKSRTRLSDWTELNWSIKSINPSLTIGQLLRAGLICAGSHRQTLQLAPSPSCQSPYHTCCQRLDYHPSLARPDMGWLRVWVLNYHSVLAEPFPSVLPWVFKVEDEQCVMGFDYFYLASTYWPCFNSPQIFFGAHSIQEVPVELLPFLTHVPDLATLIWGGWCHLIILLKYPEFFPGTTGLEAYLHFYG